MSFDKKEDISKLGTVELSDDALEGVSGGVYVTLNGTQVKLGDVSSNPSTPKPSTQGGTLTLNGAEESIPRPESYVTGLSSCSRFSLLFALSRDPSASNRPRTCGNCRFFDEIPDTACGYCRNPMLTLKK